MKLCKTSVFLCFLFFQIVSCLSCTTNPDSDTSTGALEFFNSCYKDNTDENVPSAFAKQILTWFTPQTFLQYITLVILVIPFFARFEELEGRSEGNSESYHKRLTLIHLLFRVALGYSVSFWINVSVQQARPCLCDGVLLGHGPWGMPSSETVAATIVGAYFLEYVSHGLRLFAIMPVLVAAAQVVIGHNSIGQVLGAIGIGLLIHFYATRTPTFVRFIDIILNLIAGFITLFIVKGDLPKVNFNWTLGFFEGAVWQVFAVAIYFILMEWFFIKATLRKAIHWIDEGDFFRFEKIPLINGSPEIVGCGHGVIYIPLIALFFGLSGLFVFENHIDDFLSVRLG